ncbi:MAG TPA: hypothetical protein VN724_18345 [Pyrinomonadaceae bacterium]|nr:hypothetical protein [Pyrinomonadaceae bacterium]
MQRLYSMFPQGGPGVGLLLLRIAAAGMFVLNLTHQLHLSTDTLRLFIISLLVIVCLGLLLGLLTPFLTIVTCLVALLNLFFTEPGMNVVYILRILTSAALFFLGPGAYSIDARLFGLRVAVVPPRKSRV